MWEDHWFLLPHLIKVLCGRPNSFSVEVNLEPCLFVLRCIVKSYLLRICSLHYSIEVIYFMSFHFIFLYYISCVPYFHFISYWQKFVTYSRVEPSQDIRMFFSMSYFLVLMKLVIYLLLLLLLGQIIGFVLVSVPI